MHRLLRCRIELRCFLEIEADDKGELDSCVLAIGQPAASCSVEPQTEQRANDSAATDDTNLAEWYGLSVQNLRLAIILLIGGDKKGECLLACWKLDEDTEKTTNRIESLNSQTLRTPSRLRASAFLHENND